MSSDAHARKGEGSLRQRVGLVLKEMHAAVDDALTGGTDFAASLPGDFDLLDRIKAIFAAEIAQAEADQETSLHLAWLSDLRDRVLAAASADPSREGQADE